jgi:hypothetical protein
MLFMEASWSSQRIAQVTSIMLQYNSAFLYVYCVSVMYTKQHVSPYIAIF